MYVRGPASAGCPPGRGGGHPPRNTSNNTPQTDTWSSAALLRHPTEVDMCGTDATGHGVSVTSTYAGSDLRRYPSTVTSVRWFVGPMLSPGEITWH